MEDIKQFRTKFHRNKVSIRLLSGMIKAENKDGTNKSKVITVQKNNTKDRSRNEK